MYGGSRTAVLGLIIGAFFVVSAGFFPWFQIDTGAQVSGYRLAELTLALDTSFLPPAWVAFTWYLLPALAISGFIVAMSRPSRRTRASLVSLVVALCALAATFLVIAAGASQPLQVGPVIAGAGSIAMLGAVLLAPRAPTVAVPFSTPSPGGN